MLLEIKKISKRFGEAEVLKEVSLQLQQGSILGLVGENGAGKSTLMNILGGILPPSSGNMSLEGHQFTPQSAKDAQVAGIAFIHQELNLFPNLNVAENLLLSNYPEKRIAGLSWMDHKAARNKSKALLEQVGLQVDPGTPVEQLTPAQQQLLEIGKALSAQPKIIIFDEPTTSLSQHESRQLFRLIRKLKSRKITMIYISHQLEEVMDLADSIAVLRDGSLIDRLPKTGGFRLQDIIQKMIGRDMKQYYPPRDTPPGKMPLLSVEKLQALEHSIPLSFEVKKGEVVGFYGLVGAGRSELARMIYGLDAFETGRIYWKGQLVKRPHPAGWIRKGLGFLTENRREEGLLLSQNIEQNIRLAALPGYSRSLFRWIDFSASGREAEHQAEATKVKYQDLRGQAVATLSGGNQQKVVLAKWLLTHPELLILDEPTKGIDIGARHEIYRLINQLIAKGSGLLLISSDIEELLGLCDRILVMSQGEITGSFDKHEFKRTAILEKALHGERTQP